MSKKKKKKSALPSGAKAETLAPAAEAAEPKPEDTAPAEEPEANPAEAAVDKAAEPSPAPEEKEEDKAEQKPEKKAPAEESETTSEDKKPEGEAEDNTEAEPSEKAKHNRFQTLHTTHSGEKKRREKPHIFDYEAEAAKLMKAEGGANPEAGEAYKAEKKDKADKEDKEEFEEHKITSGEEKRLRERFKFDWELEEHILEALDEDVSDLTDPDEEAEPEPIVSRTISFSQAVQAVFGLFMLIFAVIGVVATGIKISQVVKDRRDTSEQERYFEEFIMPLVACDAPTFDGAASLNEDVIITAACWDIIFNPSVYYEYTGGSYMVSYLDIDRRITKLFGPGLSYTHKTVGDTELTFEYDADSGMYRIPAYPRSPAYYPEITEMKHQDGGTELTVCYRLPITNWIPSLDTVEKTMIYTVVPTDTEYNVTAIRIGEISSSEAQ